MSKKPELRTGDGVDILVNRPDKLYHPCPDGSIATEILSYDDSHWLYVRDTWHYSYAVGDGHDTNGCNDHAREWVSKSYVNLAAAHRRAAEILEENHQAALARVPEIERQLNEWREWPEFHSNGGVPGYRVPETATTHDIAVMLATTGIDGYNGMPYDPEHPGFLISNIEELRAGDAAYSPDY